jgi:predicted transcriptional regulator
VTFIESVSVFEDPLARIFDDPAHSSEESREIIIGHSIAAEVRRAERSDENTAGIIPGDRGKDDGSWCRPPLSGG